MGWGGANRPKAISRLGRPTDREGADGDIQIMGTHSGAKFFAKWAGKWLGISDLLPAEEERPGVFTPKVWQKTISTGTAASFTVGFPEFITPSNFITYTIAVPLNTGTPIVDYWFIDSSGASSDTADSNYSFGLFAVSQAIILLVSLYIVLKYHLSRNLLQLYYFRLLYIMTYFSNP